VQSHNQRVESLVQRCKRSGIGGQQPLCWMRSHTSVTRHAHSSVKCVYVVPDAIKSAEFLYTASERNFALAYMPAGALQLVCLAVAATAGRAEECMRQRSRCCDGAKELSWSGTDDIALTTERVLSVSRVAARRTRSSTVTSGEAPGTATCSKLMSRRPFLLC
jgi:hypothetical protein